MVADPVINNSKPTKEANVASTADNINRVPLKAISGGNDNVEAQAVLTTQEIHPLVKEAAKRLINYHTAQTPVVIESWGTAKYVYGEIREKLIAFGYQIDMAENMAQRLVDHAVDHAEDNRSKHGSDVVALKLQVSNEKPDPQFETGALDVQRLDGKSDSAEVAGATSVAMGINTGGTFTTALRDSVGEILNSYALMGQALYILSELPDKSELKDVAHQATISAAADLAAGNLSPTEIAALLEQLDMFAEAGLITPEMASALKNLNQIQTLAAEGNMEGIPAAVEALVNDLNDALANDGAPNDLVQAMTEAMQLVSDKFGLQAVLEGSEYGALRQDVLKAVVIEQLTDMLGGVEGLSSEQIQAMIDQLSDPELQGADLINQLDSMNETLNNAGIKIPEIAALQDVALQNMPLNERLEFLANKQAQNLMDLITELGGIDNLPPETAELLDGLDIDTLTLDELKDALVGNGDPALVEAVQNLVVQLQTPEIQSMLPAAAAEQVTQFLSENSQLVDAVTTQATISEMNSTLVTNQAQNLMDIVAGLSGVEGVPPELAEILQQLEVAQPNLSDLKEALAGNGDPNLLAAVESLVAQLQAPESQAFLSSAGIDVLSADGITSNNIPLSAETLEIAKAIKNLEDGGSLSAVDPKILTSTVADKVDGVTVSKADAIASIIATRSEAAEIIADFKTNPDLLNNPEVARRIDILSDAGPGEINAALANVKSSIVLAEKGSIPVEGKPGFSPDVVGPQLVAIASSIPTNTAEGKVAVALVESIQATVEKFGTDTPPTPIEIVKLANDANRFSEMGVVPDAVKSQIIAISQGAQAPLPPEVKKAAGPALGGCTGKPCGCCPSDDMKRATAVTSVEPDGKVVITLKANDTNNPNDVVKLEFESKEKYDAYVKADAKASEVMSSLTQNQHGLSDQQITNSVLARLNQAQRESKTKMGEHFCDANCNHGPVIHQQDYDQADLADASAKKSSAPLTAEEVQKSFDEFFETEVEKDQPTIGGGCEKKICANCRECFTEVVEIKKGETKEEAKARQHAEIEDSIEERVAAAKSAQAKNSGPSAKAA